jgi:monofunctional biosynthetic peptidoglycan transglycosylase
MVVDADLKRRRRGPGKPAQRPAYITRVVKRIANVLLGLAVVTVLLVFSLRWWPPPITAFMMQDWLQTTWTGRQDPLRHRWVNWDAISPHARLAVVAAEDQHFPVHWGFDLKAIAKAWESNKRGRSLKGASTISQQVAKNLFLWRGRSYLRKGIEVYFTLLIEGLWPKRRILEMYLNVVEFGDGIYGVGAASERFFSKPPAALSPAESSLLAAVLPNPHRFRADRPGPHTLARRDWILKQMTALGGINYLKGL